MAIVTGQIVPPSLADRFNALIGGTGRNTVGLLAGARQPAPEADPTPAVATARAAANWLANQWCGAAQSYARSAFYAARYAEVIAGSFPTAYWRAATQTLDRTLKSIPWTSDPWTGAWNPAYQDPLRLPTLCIYKGTSSSYATPAGDGTESQPAPGWRGEVGGGYFRDAWHAQQTWGFALAYTQSLAQTRPILIHAQTAIAAHSTIRGNRAWFNIAIAIRFLRAQDNPVEVVARTCDHWAPATQLPVAIPEDNPNGWSHSLTTERIRDARYSYPSVDTATFPKLQVTVATPPSKGLYYARNDAVRVVHHSTCAVYQARTPHD